MNRRASWPIACCTLLYTYAVTPGQPEATAKAREGLRDALSCYNKALGDEKASHCMCDVHFQMCLIASKRIYLINACPAHQRAESA